MPIDLDDARAVLASCDGAPHASGAACQRERAALVEEVAQLRAALTATVGEDGCVYGCGCHYASRRDEINEEKTHVGACALARAALSPTDTSKFTKEEVQ